MRADVLAVLKQYNNEILELYTGEVESIDWWYYLDDIAINVHNYGDTGDISVSVFDWFEDVGTVDMQDNDSFTLKEFAEL